MGTGWKIGKSSSSKVSAGKGYVGSLEGILCNMLPPNQIFGFFLTLTHHVGATYHHVDTLWVLTHHILAPGDVILIETLCFCALRQQWNIMVQKNQRILKDDTRDPQQLDPLMVSFPYYCRGAWKSHWHTSTFTDVRLKRDIFCIDPLVH